jgi:hypothetical protein
MTIRTMTRVPNGRRRGARLALALALALGAPLAACRVDVTNPNAATQQEVLAAPAGVRLLAVGLQGRIGNAIGPANTITGLVAGELGNTDASQSTQREFQRYPIASANAPQIDPTNPDLLAFWSTQYQVVRTADDLLAAAEQVPLLPGTKSGITALAKAAKANALGTLAEAWQQIPLDPTQPQPAFVGRAEVLAQVQALLASARADLEATPASTEFTTTVLQPTVDLPNTIRAWQARWALAAGQYDQAIAFANAVPAGATSRLTFTSVDANPLWAAITANRYFSALSSFRTEAEAGDTRVNRFTGTAVTTPFGGAQVVPIAVYTTNADAYALFTQEELALVRAEAHARSNRLGEAIAALNPVRTAAGLPARTAAELPTQQAVLDEILRQRRYALFLTGTRWADLRRFGRGAEARVAWLPYPAQERASNPGTPGNP